jgi:hypothetical protein
MAKKSKKKAGKRVSKKVGKKIGKKASKRAVAKVLKSAKGLKVFAPVEVIRNRAQALLRNPRALGIYVQEMRKKGIKVV